MLTIFEAAAAGEGNKENVGIDGFESSGNFITIQARQPDVHNGYVWPPGDGFANTLGAVLGYFDLITPPL
jgi:hypothetical protein